MNRRNNNWGLTQQQRFPAALAPTHARLDERTPAQLMAMAPRYAELLNFFDLTGTAVCDWRPFFADEICFLLADICCHPADTEMPTQPLSPESIPESIKDGSTKDGLLLHEIHTLATRIDGWYQRAYAYDERHLGRPTSPITMTLTSVIESDLAPWVERITSSPYLQAWRAMTTARAEMQPAPFAVIWNSVQSASPNPRVDLQSALAAFRSGTPKLGQAAQAYLHDLLMQSDHLPHTTLYLAFLELYKCLQADMNRFTERHLDYYYNTILALCAAPAQPDTATAIFALAPGCPQYLLKAGSGLNAGKDSAGIDIVFASDLDIMLNQGSIISLRTLYLERDATPGANSTPPVLSVEAAPVADSSDGVGTALENPDYGWSTFGATSGAPDAELGFVIASPALLLEQGVRTVSLIFTFANADADNLFESYAASVAADSDGMPQRQALADAFLLYVSGENGWQQITDFRFAPAPTTSQANWILSFTLEADAAAVIPDTALLPQVCGWPMLKLRLNPDARVYAYSSLIGLRIDSLKLRVAVRGFANAELQTSDGKISPGKPFPPLGMSPLIGAFLQVSHPEISTKQIDSVALTINWQNLPPQKGGFATYYHDYLPLVFTNTSFTVDTQVYADSVWNEIGTASLLFAQDQTQTLLPQTLLPLDLSGLNWTDASNASATIAPGTLRFTLSSPEYGFGSGLYPRLFAESAIKNIKIIENKLKLLGGKPQPVIMPNPPFTPIATSVLLDYTAHDDIELGAPDNSGATPLQFYHIHPFGYAPPEQSAPTLFPEYQNDGYLYLGLSDLTPPQTLTLHFEFRPVTGSAATDTSAPAIIWRYLSDNKWCEFDTGSVISDTTNFTGSGIVSLNLPSDIDTGNTLMPDLSANGTFWVAACTIGDPACYGNTINILPQAMTATRVIDSSNAPPLMPLPAASITGLSQKVGQIKSVSQPYPSQGGRSAETTQQFQARVSERLRHKQRASLPRDYEQIVLEAFPSVWQVKCIGPNNSRSYPESFRAAPGQIVLAVAAPIGDAPDIGTPFDGTTLSEIGSHVQDLSSASLACIDVRNIGIEQIKVFVNVRFHSQMDSGLCLQQLNDALVRFLSPWLEQASPHLNIGSSWVEVDQVAALIRKQPYVAAQGAVIMAQIWQLNRSRRVRWFDEGQRVYPSTPWSTLVSVAQHCIRECATDGAVPTPFKGIGSMSVDAEFIVEATLPDAAAHRAGTYRHG